MAVLRHNGETSTPRAGYVTAVAVSAVAHAAVLIFAFFIAPRLFHSYDKPLPAYTVKIVDSLPAGDLGTHLPRLSGHKPQPRPAPPPPREEPSVEAPKPPEIKPPPDDKNAIALNTKHLESPTPTPTPEPTPEMTPPPKPSPTVVPTHLPKKKATPKETPTPKTKAKATPVVVAKAEPTPNVQQRLEKLKQQLRANLKKAPVEDEEADEEDDEEETDTPAAPDSPKGGGPVAGPVASAGKGMGIGPGTGSAGVTQDLEFLMYYQAVQDRVKKAWNFGGGSSDLTATVDFAIGPDGALTGIKLAKSSNDPAFDDSVLRAIRRAAPFPPPPDKYRSEFGQGIEALFKLGELKS